MNTSTPRHVSIVKPGEVPKARLSRTRLSIRVRQVLAAIEAVKVKGAETFTAPQLSAEIGCATSSVHYALQHLRAQRVIECLTPQKNRYQKWQVIDWEKVIAFRQALEAGNVEFSEAETPPSFFQRFLNAVTGRKNQDKRLSRVEDRLAAAERKLDQLIHSLGGM